MGVGRFSVQMDVSNHHDELRAQDGVIPVTEVRRARVSGVVDTRAARLVLPGSVARTLGLPETGKTTVRYADGRRDEKAVVGEVQLEIQGRRGVFSAVVEPARTDALVGAIVLEELDFLADSTRQALVPRDPNVLVTELD
jgi:predicted aspartyl protease